MRRYARSMHGIDNDCQRALSNAVILAQLQANGKFDVAR